MLAVALRFDAVVEDGHAAVILFGTDKAADGLDQFDAGFGNGDFDKRIAATLFNPTVLGFLDRIVRHGKRQLGNNDLHAGRAGQVEAFGKTVEAENNAGFAFGNGLMVPLQQDSLGQLALYKQKRQVFVRQS